MTDNTVYLVTHTSNTQTHTKQLFIMRDGTPLNIPWEIGNTHTVIESELVTELSDMSPTNSENIVENDTRIVKFIKNTSHEATAYETVSCPIDIKSIYAMHNVNIIDHHDDDVALNNFLDWLLKYIGKSIYVGTSGQGSYFASPTQVGNIVTMNAKVLWRY
jgi:hypothetical protein